MADIMEKSKVCALISLLRRGLSVLEVARQIGVGQGTVKNWRCRVGDEDPEEVWEDVAWEYKHKCGGAMLKKAEIDFRPDSKRDPEDVWRDRLDGQVFEDVRVRAMPTVDMRAPELEGRVV